MTKQVLEGVKVLDLSWVGVGPVSTRYLSDYGATTVRVESVKRLDLLRMSRPFKNSEPGLNRSMFWADFNASKLGLGLDLNTSKGQEVARELVKWADVVTESFTPGTLAKWGLDYESNKKINPEIIMLSTCMQGQTGPRSSFRGYGNMMAALSGYYEINGYPDRGPTPCYGAYTDFTSPRFCAAALMAAIDYKRRTGKGQFIDVSQYECSVQLLGPQLLDYAINENIAGRKGNRCDYAAPHGVFPAKGDDRWVAIAVESDEEWLAMKQIMRSPEWADDTKFDTLVGRKANEDELEQRISEWTARYSAKEVMFKLQPHIAAGVVHDQSGLYEDPQIAHREYFQWLDHSEMGTVPYNGTQALLSETPPRITKPSPCLGEDSRMVLRDFAGMSDEQIQGLIDEGIVEETLGQFSQTPAA